MPPLLAPTPVPVPVLRGHHRRPPSLIPHSRCRTPTLLAPHPPHHGASHRLDRGVFPTPTTRHGGKACFQGRGELREHPHAPSPAHAQEPLRRGGVPFRGAGNCAITPTLRRSCTHRSRYGGEACF
ncbi:hypothetical protein SBD_4644 [Streptomyces bottropensis ATCC 25435]|uniref:Uncharacterized protein n=1 Tax=Streptomyces bottropensis ATCC 25435 TaxID=1054862 RepID=M3FPS8_9ACTN|nr:hypothetical protein SBD_4644 [Streptomyces bottropensis ATCC 25435]